MSLYLVCSNTHRNEKVLFPQISTFLSSTSPINCAPGSLSGQRKVKTVHTTNTGRLVPILQSGGFRQLDGDDGLLLQSV